MFVMFVLDLGFLLVFFKGCYLLLRLMTILRIMEGFCDKFSFIMLDNFRIPLCLLIQQMRRLRIGSAYEKTLHNLGRLIHTTWKIYCIQFLYNREY